jgi:hypothetical protein
MLLLLLLLLILLQVKVVAAARLMTFPKLFCLGPHQPHPQGIYVNIYVHCKVELIQLAPADKAGHWAVHQQQQQQQQQEDQQQQQQQTTLHPTRQA